MTRRHARLQSLAKGCIEMDRFSECLAFTLREEGGYCDDPRDPGRATNMGITLATLRAWTGNPRLTAADIRGIRRSVAAGIYRAEYWNKLRCDALPTGIDLMVFDFGVNAGAAGSARLLQTMLGFIGDDLDGCIGPQTLDAVAAYAPRTAIGTLAAAQVAHYRTLAEFDDFGAGWLARTGRRKTAALAAAAPAANAVAVVAGAAPQS